MKSFLYFLSMAMLATVVSAFSRDGPPRVTRSVPSRALSVAGKNAATAALVVALTLPFAEPAWAAAYVSNSDVLTSIAELKTEMKSLDTKIDNKFTKIDNKFDSVNNKIDTAKNEVFWGPTATAIVGILASLWMSNESNKSNDRALDKANEKGDRVAAEAKDQVKLGVQEGVQQVLLFLFVGAAISMYFTVKG
jgi:hypothetical protein